MKNLRRFGWVSAAVISWLLLNACGRKPDAPSVGEKPLPASVRTVTVASERRIATEEVVGTVRPKLSAVIAAKLSGAIQRMDAVPGQAVKAGDVLVQLDAREAQARLDQATAARDQARNDIGRFTKLLAEKAITQQEYDAVRARERIAEASVAEVESLLSYTRINAPFDGVITRKHTDVGDLATPGKPLLEMEDPNTLRLEADVPEAAVGRLKLGDKLSVQIHPITTTLEATVSEISPAADPNSRTFLVKLDFPATPGLRSGQFGRVAVPVAEVEALRVPASAVVVRGQLEMVFVVTNQTAQMRLVKSGKKLGSTMELVSGLNPGERIVIDGAAGLVDGQSVEVKP